MAGASRDATHEPYHGRSTPALSREQTPSMPTVRTSLRSIGIVLTAVLALAACSDGSPQPPATQDAGSMDLVRVPADASTMERAAELVAPGGMILISPGTYRETLTVHTKDVTVRGTDRNTVIFDGRSDAGLPLKANGIVGTAEGFTVENLTVRYFTLNGVLVTGVVDANNEGLGRGSDGYAPIDPTKFPPKPGFAIRYVTASNNGLYGIYAFNRQHGVIEHNFASGSADSGIYVGQCRPCNILVSANVVTGNAVGIENANASAPMVITGNRSSGNRVGMTMLSNYQEAYVPLTGATVVGNVVSDNVNPTSPAQAEGGFGIGIGLSAPVSLQVLRNRVEGNELGVVITSEEDLAPKQNVVGANLFRGNVTDLVYTVSARAPGVGNCVDQKDATTFPKSLPAPLRCDTPGDAVVPPAATGPTLPTAPAGLPFTDVPLPPDQPGMPGDPATSPHPPTTSVTMPDIASIGVPPADLLASSSS